MGILRGREEYIPVTCAVLKDVDRDAFFTQIRKNRAGTPEELARWLDVSVALVQDWITGKTHIPFHTLQNIAYQFSVELPSVSELRRESVSASQLPSAKPPEPPAPPPVRRTEAGSGERQQTARPRHKIGRQKERPKPREQRPIERQPHPHQPVETKKHEPKWPKLSDALAYWVGGLYAGVRIEGERFSLLADRRMGQNFAAAWARKTKELFGVACDLSMIEGGKVQQAACEISGSAEFLGRTCPGAGSSNAEISLPRWIWSNPAWKTACLRGLGDVSIHFTRHPAIAFVVPASLARSLQKLLASVGLRAQTGRDGAWTISGKQELERYFELVGAENLKLRDQWAAFCRNEAEPAEASGGEETSPSAAEPAEPEKPTHSEPQAPAPEPEQPAPSSSPQVVHKKARRPKKMLYRGKPGR